MQLYNTLTKKVDEFKPLHGNQVKMYTCGPTVYHFAHISKPNTLAFFHLTVYTLQRFFSFPNLLCGNGVYPH